MMKSLEIPKGVQLASIWVVWSFLSLGLLGWGLWVVLDAVGSLKDMAAWVQAIGSVGAILAAVAIARRGVWQQKADKLLEGYGYMEKAFGVAAYANEVIKGASQYILEGAPTSPMLRYHINLLDISLEDLKEISYSRIDDSDAAEAFLAIKRNVNLTRSAILVRLETNGSFETSQVAAWGPNACSEAERMSVAMIRYLGRHPWLLDEVHARHIEGKR